MKASLVSVEHVRSGLYAVNGGAFMVRRDTIGGTLRNHRNVSWRWESAREPMRLHGTWLPTKAAALNDLSGYLAHQLANQVEAAQ